MSYPRVESYLPDNKFCLDLANLSSPHLSDSGELEIEPYTYSSIGIQLGRNALQLTRVTVYKPKGSYDDTSLNSGQNVYEFMNLSNPSAPVLKFTSSRTPSGLMNLNNNAYAMTGEDRLVISQGTTPTLGLDSSSNESPLVFRIGALQQRMHFSTLDASIKLGNTLITLSPRDEGLICDPSKSLVRQIGPNGDPTIISLVEHRGMWLQNPYKSYAAEHISGMGRNEA